MHREGGAAGTHPGWAIECSGLGRDFSFFEKRPGLAGSLASLFNRKKQMKSAVSFFDLQVPRGEIVGLLGPNGAGKTTLMKMFTGIVVPSRGSCRVLGFTPHERDLAFRKSIALVMGQKSQLWWDIPAQDSFQLLQRYYEIEPVSFRRRLGDLTEVLQVSSLLNVHVRKLSLGERMKMELIACLLHDPSIIFLDEPSIGLDIVSQNNVREFIRGYHAERCPTIILTSHYMADVSALCSRIVLILGGDKKFDGPVTAFQRLLGDEKIVTLQLGRALAPGERQLLAAFEPVWAADGLSVEMKVPHAGLRECLGNWLGSLPVEDLQTGKMPIERVMEVLLRQPQLLQDTRPRASVPAGREQQS